MVRHQNPGVHSPAGALTCLTKRREKNLPVAFIAKDWFPSVSPIEEMIDGACELHSGLPGHERGQITARRFAKSSRI
jgi:hypothetical protein